MIDTRLRLRFIVPLALATVGTLPLRGDILTLAALDAGFVTEAGGSSKGDGTVTPPATFNYSVGREVHYSAGFLFSPLAPMDRKNYFVFDLAPVSGPIIDASMSIFAGPDDPPPFPGGTHGYESLDAFETYELAATSDPGAALSAIVDLAVGNSVGPSMFDEPTDPLIGTAAGLYAALGDGPVLASIDVTASDDGTFLFIVFTPDGLAYLNSHAGGPVVLAGSLPTAIPPDSPQLIFGFTGPDIPGGSPFTPTLTLTFVPEPGLGCGMALLAGLLGFLRSSRNRPNRQKGN